MDTSIEEVSASGTQAIRRAAAVLRAIAKALAHGAAERSPSLPDVPTLAEVGVHDLTFAFSFGFWAPAGTPDAAVNRLNAAFNNVLKEPDIRARLAQAGVVPVGGAPEVHSRQVSDEQAMWAQAAAKIGYKPE